MAENLAVSTARLEQLVVQIMNETDPVKYDLLGSEIWRVLGELERLRDQHLHLLSKSGDYTSLNLAQPPEARKLGVIPH